ncbi:MAG: patatin-like phospholipase family protein [Acidobacteria bacterium]|nr:patatin-like phospholipase family protein [Acidobacteriota bacterium]
MSNAAIPWTRRIDTFFRFLDLTTQRFDAGTRLEEYFGIHRHTVLSYLWPAVVCTAVLTGMPVISGWRLLAAAATLLSAVVILLLAAKFTGERGVGWDALLQCGLVLVCCLVVVVGGSRKVPEEGGLYLHLLVPIAAIFALSIVAAVYFTPACFRKYTETTTYPAGIAQTQLFQRRPPPQRAGLGTLSQGVVLALIRAPQLLFLPCLVAMIVPAEFVPMCLWVTLVPLVLLVMSGLDERVEQIVNQMSNRFFQNGAMLISLLVIALGAARYFGVSYVTTVLDTAAGAQIFLYLCFAYAMVWWQDYWIERLAGQEMLRIAGGAAVDGTDMRMHYDFKGDNGDLQVPVDNRRIQLHGIGRFLILRPDSFERAVKGEQPPFWIGAKYPAFHTWTFAEFFAHVAGHTHPAGDAQPSPQRIRQRLLQHAMIIRVLTGAAFVAAGLWQSGGVQYAAAKADNVEAGPVKLAKLIAEHPADRPVILLAASGGGTRAAVFTAAVLEGLAKKGALADVLLGSGVSGGGASLAYFGGHRDKLDWEKYFAAMQTAFIRDVLERSSEWRMVAGKRLGTLLEESFDRHWDLTGRKAIGHVTDMALIFNTTIAGHYGEPAPREDLEESASRNPRKHESAMAGGRLILTNLDTVGMFEGVNGPYPIRLPVVVNDPRFKLTAAAALNANFPPVFSNAPVDVSKEDRYWVTDGGAADNRGAEMLLYALRKAIQDAPELQTRRMLVLIADAGAAPGTYSQDRGIGSAIGAGKQFAMHLVAELSRGLGGNIKLVYVPMPRMLSESFGTHWMLQSTIAVSHGDTTVSVDGPEMVKALRSLYGQGDCQMAMANEARTVCEWARTEALEFKEEWAKVGAWLAAK